MQFVPEGFDLDALLAPLPGERPTGGDPRDDYSPQSLYRRLRDARAEARAAEREADTREEGAPPPPEWATIRALAAQALREAAKDLEVAAWYTESLLRGDGLTGLAAGSRLMAGLVENFWDELFPLPDEDGIATRVAPVAGLNGEGVDGTLIQPLLKLKLFDRPTGEALALWQYDQAARLLGEGDATRRQQRLAAGVLAFDQVETEARAAGAAHFARLRAAAAAALEGWNALGAALDARAGADAPPTGRVRKVLEDIHAIAAKYAPPEEAAPAAAPPESAPEAAADEPAARPAGPAGAIATREDALRALGEIAAFFRRTEPNSPLADTLEEAVRRGRMAWPELLEEIVPDPALRSAILTSLGIKPQAQ